MPDPRDRLRARGRGDLSHPPLAELVRVARGDAPADLVLAGGTVVDVASGQLVEADVAVWQGVIAGVGERYEAAETIDVAGRFVAPAFIEGHLHVESSLLTPDRFAPLVAARGTGTVISDPHEIANVCGADGIRWMLEAARDQPVDIRVMLSSCVPASDLATAGAALDAEDLAALADDPQVHGLAEVMSFPLVVGGEPGVLAKLERFAGGVIDGHAPGLRGRGLNAYVAAGPSSDHECTTAAEAAEKLRRGMRILIREGSTAKNLEALIGLVEPGNAHRFLMVTDDRHVADLTRQGHLDHQLRLAVEAGVDPATAVAMVTLFAAEHFRLHDRGLVAPGRRADLVVLDDLAAFGVRQVFHAGALVAHDGLPVAADAGTMPPPPPSGVVVDVDGADLSVAAGAGRLRVIGAVAGQIVTEALEIEPPVADGEVVADPAGDLLKLCVFERHGRNGNVGVGFVRGLGLRSGAIASTVAHDAHNLVVAGADDDSIRTAARRVAAMGGGLCAAEGGQVLADLALPVAGLMSDQPAGQVAAAHDALHRAATELGAEHDPFMLLSFLALEVIGERKLTDRGLVDTEGFALVEPFTG